MNTVNRCVAQNPGQPPPDVSPTLSVVIPVFNEAPNIPEFYRRATAVLRPLNIQYEIVAVDDGSTDHSWNILSSIALRDSAVRPIRLSRNFGHQRALLAGLHDARGAAIISMDGDLQHPPEMIPTLVEKWMQGAKIVLTERIDSESASISKRLTSRMYYRVFTFLTDTPIAPGSSDFRLIDRIPLEYLLEYGRTTGFLRGAVQMVGFERATVPFQSDRRFAGKSKYTIGKMLDLATSGLVSHSTVPLKIGLWLGTLTGLFAIAELGYVIVSYFLGNTVPGWASALGLIALMFATLFFVIGIIGLYINDIHRIVKQAPQFIVAERINDPRQPVSR